MTATRNGALALARGFRKSGSRPGSAVEVAILDGGDDCLVVLEGMMVGRRLHLLHAQPTPDDGTAHRVQRIEQRQQQRVLRRFRDHAMQAVVPRFVLPPGLRRAGALHAEVHLRNMGRGSIERGHPRHLRLEQQARAHHLGGVGAARHGRHVGNGLDRTAADEGAFADMTPDLILRFEHRQRLAQAGAGDAKRLRQLALWRQTAVERHLDLREIGAQLGKGGPVGDVVSHGLTNLQANRAMSTFPIAAIAAIFALLPLSILAGRGRLERNALGWLLLAAALIGGSLPAIMELQSGWRSGLAASLHVTVAATLVVFTAAVVLNPPALRLAALVGPYAILLVVLGWIAASLSSAFCRLSVSAKGGSTRLAQLSVLALNARSSSNTPQAARADRVKAA